MDIPFLNLPAQKGRLGPELDRRINRVMEHCRFVLGPEVGELEEKLADYTGVRHAVAVASGTDALLMMLMAEGIGRGDCVFLPSFTYVATAEVVCLLGARPIFVDVDPGTFQTDPASLERRITECQGQDFGKKALLAVDLFGQPAPWIELAKIARRHDLSLLDDCAQSFGASLHGRKSGGWAPSTGLSFFPSKTLGCYGDGGAVLTDDPERARLFRSLRNHGAVRHPYDIRRIGLNARLDTLQAAVLLAKFTCLDAEIERREQIARRYDRELPALLQRPGRVEGGIAAWSVYCVQAPADLRDGLAAYLRENGIGFGIYYPRPLHFQPAYRDLDQGAHQACPNAELLSGRVLALPVFADLTDAQQGYVIEKINLWAANLPKAAQLPT